MTIDQQAKRQIKDQKLRQLSVQHYELQLQRVIYTARGEMPAVDQVDEELAKIEASYDAVAAVEI